MKTFIILVLASLSSMAMAQTEKPILEIIKTAGMVRPGTGTSSSCSVYTDKVVSVNEIGAIKSTTIKAVQLQGDFNGLIEAASKGKITNSPAPMDLPTTFYEAYKADGTRVDLLASGSVCRKNESLEANYLVTILNTLCN